MADVECVIDPRSVLRHLDMRSFVDSTMLRLWGDARQLERARRVLERSGLAGAYLDAEELRSRAVPVDAGHADALWLLPEGTPKACDPSARRVRRVWRSATPSCSTRDPPSRGC
jgi:hypothetical protein